MAEPRGRRCRAERGTVLMLMPAAVLIVVLLGAVAVDLAIVFLGRRELAAAAAAAANDAVTYGLDQAVLRETGTYELDPVRVLDAVEASLAARDIDVSVQAPRVEIVGSSEVRVTLRGDVDYVFATAVPGVPHGAEVEASAIAVARGP